MRKRFMLLLILLLSTLLPVQFSLAADDVTSVAQTQATAIPARGTLYQVHYRGKDAQDHTAYLFGTIHVGKAEFYPFEPQLTKALADAGVLALEVDMRDTKAIQDAKLKYAVYPNFGTVDKHVSAKTMARTKKAIESLGLPYDGVAHFKSWMIANLLIVSALEKQGYHPDQSGESNLMRPENIAGKKVVGLESAQFQLALFDKLTEKQQEQYLVDCLNDLESGELAKKTTDLLDAWAKADEPAYDTLLKETQADKTFSGKFFMRELLAKRNPVMANHIADLIKDNNTVFVGIGLLHLIGPDGVPSLLEKKGFEVKRIY